MNNKNKFLLSALTLGVMAATTVSAADKKFLRNDTNRLAIAAQSSPSLMSTNTAQFVGLGTDESLQIRKSILDADGSSTIRYQQLYKGVPVLGDDVVISSHADGSFKRAHGAVVSNIAADLTDVTPTLSMKQAMRKAKQASSPAGQGVLNTQSGVSYTGETGRLVIWQDKAGTAKLAYQISYVQHGDSPSRPHLIIDAKSGDILDHYDNLQTANAQGPGGNEKTGQYYYGTDFGDLDVTQSGNTCTMNNANVKTINLNHGTSGSSAYSFNCPENTFKSINGAFSPLNDAHFFGGVVFDMYNAWVGTAPLSFQLQMRVHYSNSYENAFWDGSAMTFGDGANTFYPLVSLDVSAHEVSHGFTEQNSGLVYSGKSGGLNEAFSDMAGEAAESYMNGSNDWLVGAQIFKGNGSLRYMNNPPQDGQSIDNQSDYSSGMDVHYSSGVYNKAFYNLATTSGWTTQMAFQVYARANQNYWTSSVNWDQAGDGVLDSACDLGFDTDDVQASLTAVGVNSSLSSGSTCDTTPPPPPPGDNVLTNGVAETGLAESQGNDVVYTMEVPSGATNINFVMSGGTGDADMYVRFGSAPTDSTYDCRPYLNGNNETCTGSSTGGTYYVRVKAYTTFSGVSLTGSYTEPGTGGGLDPIDSTVSDISVARRAWSRYTLELEAGYSDLVVEISGGTGDADLYVNFGSQSSTNNYDCRPYKNGNAETCTFNAPAAGTWHIDIRGYTAASGVTLHVTANP
jgi:vibriolysin